MYGEREWREVQRLRAAGKSQAEIAHVLDMSRTTVRRLLLLDEPPRYRRHTPPTTEYTPEEQHNLRMLARALVATARQMLEEEAAN